MPKAAPAKVFIIEDDEDIREIVLYALRSAGFAVEGFETGEEFLAQCSGHAGWPDMLLLDIMLPKEDGLSILRRLRASPQAKALPVILLTAKGSEYDRVKGLDMGADDYLVKPFSVIELVSRINAVLRRSGGGSQPSQLSCGNLVLDDARRLVLVDGMGVELTYKEFELLHYLLLNSGLAVARDRIMEAVWGYDFTGESRTLDMHIRSLRRKLGGAGGLIKTVRNVGYKLEE